MLCADKGISISALEKAAGIGNGTIAKWDGTNGPSLKSLEKIASVFGISVSDLVDDQGK